MALAQLLVPELEHEMAGVRKTLERIPADKFEWRAHAKSNTLGWLANHMAELPGWINVGLDTEELDIEPPGGPQYESPKLDNVPAVLELFDRSLAAATQSLAGATDEKLRSNWTLFKGGRQMMTMTKYDVVRSFVINHSIHHRGILTVYLRLLGVPVPALYGPSGDEGWEGEPRH